MDNETIIDRLSTSSGYDVEKTRLILSEFVGILRGCCLKGDAVAIPGFGTFQARKFDEHIFEDSEKGKRYLMPPCVKPEFKTSVVLKKKLLG